MKRLLSLIFLLVTLHEAGAAPLDGRVKSIIGHSKLKHADASIYAIKVSDGSPLIDINKENPLNPASCTKIVTAAVALKTLGPDYRFVTEYFTDAKPNRGVVGNLWIKGYGDPSYVIEYLEATADDIVKKGLTLVDGNIIFDDSYLDNSTFPGIQQSSTRSYNARPSAVALNHSAITVKVFPNTKPEMAAVVEVDAPGIKVVNQAKTGTRYSKKTIHVTRTYTKEGEVVKVRGTVPIGSSKHRQFFNVTNPPLHFANALRGLLQERGVATTGTAKRGKIPENGYLLYKWKSPPLSEILRNMNIFSNNFMAEQIVKDVGAAIEGAPGTTGKGVPALRNYLKTIGAKEYSIENGSRLSTQNRISASDLIKVLKDVHGNKSIRGPFINSLSIFGVDGTTERWKSKLLHNKARVKTGSLTRVSSLAGFMPYGDDMAAFVVIFNGKGVDLWTGRDIEIKILEALASTN